MLRRRQIAKEEMKWINMYVMYAVMFMTLK